MPGATGPPMSLSGVDQVLRRRMEERDRVAGDMLDLDDPPSHRLLKGMTPTGETARRWEQAQVTLVSVLTPLCLDVAKSDPEFSAKMIGLKKASAYSRSDFVVAAGWGTKLATDDINKSVARTCADTLLL